MDPSLSAATAAMETEPMSIPMMLILPRFREKSMNIYGGKFKAARAEAKSKWKKLYIEVV
jgi:hypothetical protein